MVYDKVQIFLSLNSVFMQALMRREEKRIPYFCITVYFDLIYLILTILESKLTNFNLLTLKVKVNGWISLN
jgi:hypothetical protein